MFRDIPANEEDQPGPWLILGVPPGSVAARAESVVGMRKWFAFRYGSGPYAIRLVAKNQATESTQLKTATREMFSRAVLFLSEVFMAWKSLMVCFGIM